MNKILFALLLIFVMSNMPIALAQPQTDPAGDLLDRNGTPTAGEPYLDIIESKIEVSGNNYVATIKLAGDVPSQTSSSDRFIEWDIMVDIDQSNTTGAWSGETNKAWRQLMVNGIGVDLMARMAMSGTQMWAEVYIVKDQTWDIAFFSVSGNQITLTAKSDILSLRWTYPGNFDFTALVRKYSVGGSAKALPPANTLQAFDKVPNSGYYAFRAGTVTPIPEFHATQLLAVVILSVTMLALNLRETRKKEP